MVRTVTGKYSPILALHKVILPQYKIHNSSENIELPRISHAIRVSRPSPPTLSAQTRTAGKKIDHPPISGDLIDDKNQR